jgi:hypothetical protein
MFNPPSKTAQDYRDRADACQRLADTAGSEQTRETMQYLALRWRTLAFEAEAKTNKHHPSARPLPSSV